MDIHAELDRVFFDHQCALLRYDFAAALRHLERFASWLLKHMSDEENVLLPVYAERAEIPPAGAVRIFLDDHEKIRSYLPLFREQIEKILAEVHPEASLILLLDREAFFKRLMSHHDRREHEILYPALDAVTTDAEKTELLARVTCSFDVAWAANSSAI